MSTINYTTHTQGQTTAFLIMWKIPNFDQLLENFPKRELRAEISDTKSEFNHRRFQFKMLFLGRNNDIIEIYYLSSNPVFLESILTVCSRSEERTIVNKEYQTVQGNKWQYLTTFLKQDIHGYNSKFLRSDCSLYLKIQFKITNNIQIEHSTVPETRLNDELEKLLEDGLFSDVTIKSAEGVEFKVHKAVLAGRSAVLKAHFEHNTTECHTNIIESLLETAVLREVLSFIYSDKAPRVDEIPEKLLYAADYYQLNRLKRLCEEALHKKLTVENALETLQLADLHSANTLRQLTLDFIKDGQAKLITKTEGWAQLQSIDLIKRIYEYIVEDDMDANKIKKEIISCR